MINLTLIFGEKASGKTTFVKNYVQKRITIGKKIFGVISEFDFGNPSEKSYYAIQIPSKERFLLCSTNNVAETKFEDWKFFYETYEICSKFILENFANAEAIIIDEIGQLELEGKGWHPLVSNLLQNYNGELILTGRSSRLAPYFKFFVESSFANKLASVSQIHLEKDGDGE
jgi:Predicted nucleotide kinase